MRLFCVVLTIFITALALVESGHSHQQSYAAELESDDQWIIPDLKFRQKLKNFVEQEMRKDKLIVLQIEGIKMKRSKLLHHGRKIMICSAVAKLRNPSGIESVKRIAFLISFDSKGKLIFISRPELV